MILSRSGSYRLKGNWSQWSRYKYTNKHKMFTRNGQGTNDLNYLRNYLSTKRHPRYKMTKVGTKWFGYELTFKSHFVPSWTRNEMTKVGTKWPVYGMVVTGYEMTKKWVRNDKNGTKWPGYEMTWVRTDLGTKWPVTVVETMSKLAPPVHFSG